MGKSFARSLEECRFAFFSPDLPEADLVRYQRQLAACSPVKTVDLRGLAKVCGHVLGVGGGRGEGEGAG